MGNEDGTTEDNCRRDGASAPAGRVRPCSAAPLQGASHWRPCTRCWPSIPREREGGGAGFFHAPRAWSSEPPSLRYVLVHPTTRTSGPAARRRPLPYRLQPATDDEV